MSQWAVISPHSLRLVRNRQTAGLLRFGLIYVHTNLNFPLN